MIPTTTPSGVETKPEKSHRPDQRRSAHLVRQIALHPKSMRSWPNGHRAAAPVLGRRFDSRRTLSFFPTHKAQPTHIDGNRGKSAFLPHAHPYHSKHSDPIDRAETQIIHITPRAGTIGSRKPANAHGRCQITADNHKSGPHFTINPTISTTIQHTPTGYVHTRRNLPYLIPNCEAKSSWAGLVLAWGTSWEPHGDVTFFFRQHTSNLLRLCTTLPSAIAMSLPPLRYHRNTHAYYHKSTDKIGGRPGLLSQTPP